MHVAILGAGVAGLAAAHALGRAGIYVTLLEATERVGGRIWTVASPRSGLPTELGAELIHGRPREIFAIVRGAGLHLHELTAPSLVARSGVLQAGEDLLAPVTDLLERVPLEGPDSTIDAFLREQRASAELSQRTRAYVEGFHAAPADDVSARSLKRAQRAAQAVGGEALHVLRDGYAALVDVAVRRLDRAQVHLRLGHVVEEVRWRAGRVGVLSRFHGEPRSLEADAAIVTLPVGVLQEGRVRFTPALDLKRRALEAIGMGRVQRLTLHLKGPIWQGAPNRRLRGRWCFLFTDDPEIPTFWRRGDDDVLVAWAGAQQAARLPSTVAARREVLVRSLSRQLGMSPGCVDEALLRVDSHDWQSDPYACGAYSYHRRGGEHASCELARPIEQTLFFAGEATDLAFQHGTVHGALASGLRAAREIIVHQRVSDLGRSV